MILTIEVILQESSAIPQFYKENQNTVQYMWDDVTPFLELSTLVANLKS